MLYTKLENTTLQQIIQQFDIAPLLQWQVLEGGAENTNILLQTTQQKLVLTICERKTVAETTILVDLLRHLEAHHFKTTMIIPNKSGQTISFYNKKPIVLKKYIAGKIVNKPTTELLEQIGSTIGQLHSLPTPDYLPKAYSYGQQVFATLSNTEISHPFVDWLTDMHTHIKSNLDNSLPKALIHGDVFFSNVVVDPLGKPIIIDFEEACYYYRMYDIGMAIVGLCNVEGTIDFSKATPLMHGYEQIISLEKLEKERLHFFIGYAATATAFWRFRQFNILAPTPSRKNTYLEMKNIADEMRKKSQKNGNRFRR